MSSLNLFIEQISDQNFNFSLGSLRLNAILRTNSYLQNDLNSGKKGKIINVTNIAV